MVTSGISIYQNVSDVPRTTLGLSKNLWTADIESFLKWFIVQKLLKFNWNLVFGAYKSYWGSYKGQII